MQLMLKRITEKLQGPYSPIPLLDHKFYQQKKSSGAGLAQNVISLKHEPCLILPHQ